MMFKKVAGLILPQYREPSVCEACGELFTCGATLSGCWCQEVKLDEPVRALLRARYDRCLCRACLENFAKGERKDGEKEKPLPGRTAH